MEYRLVVFNEKQWLKDLSALPRQVAGRILDKLEKLEHLPWSKDVHAKKLQHYDLADFRMRIGDYRVLFNLDKEGKQVVLLRVLHRSQCY
ncbi:MAG: type II toxin-antitoxin system RelE/ParE family toxin [bacterium]|nr:type II toxin-antitoxin system RelE/ParE family toxin [bacterium]